MFHRGLYAIVVSAILLIAQPARATANYSVAFVPTVNMLTTDTSADIMITIDNTGSELIAINAFFGYIGLDFQETASFDLNQSAYGTFLLGGQSETIRFGTITFGQVPAPGTYDALFQGGAVINTFQEAQYLLNLALPKLVVTDPVVVPPPPPSPAPEPSVWALMVLGFGLCGTALRRSAIRRRMQPG